MACCGDGMGGFGQPVTDLQVAPPADDGVFQAVQGSQDGGEGILLSAGSSIKRGRVSSR